MISEGPATTEVSEYSEPGVGGAGFLVLAPRPLLAPFVVVLLGVDASCAVDVLDTKGVSRVAFPAVLLPCRGRKATDNNRDGEHGTAFASS